MYAPPEYLMWKGPRFGWGKKRGTVGCAAFKLLQNAAAFSTAHTNRRILRGTLPLPDASSSHTAMSCRSDRGWSCRDATDRRSDTPAAVSAFSTRWGVSERLSPMVFL